MIGHFTHPNHHLSSATSTIVLEGSLPEKIVKILRTLVIEHKSHKRWRPWAVRTGPLGSMSESFAIISVSSLH
jgi:hypothetical protein